MARFSLRYTSREHRRIYKCFNMFWKTFIFAFLVVGAYADEPQIPDVLKAKIKEGLKEVCKRAGAEDKVDDVSNSVSSFVDCIKGLINVEQLKQEIEAAKPNGALDEVFKKYCAKTPELKTCLHTLIDGTSPCVEETSKSHLIDAKNGTDQLIDFVCYKDGDRIALFIAEKGPECFQSKSEAIQTCARSLSSHATNIDNVKKWTLAEKCGKFDELFACIVKALETCENPTPANMVESLFKYVRKQSPCESALPTNKN